MAKSRDTDELFLKSYNEGVRNLLIGETAEKSTKIERQTIQYSLADRSWSEEGESFMTIFENSNSGLAST